MTNMTTDSCLGVGFLLRFIESENPLRRPVERCFQIRWVSTLFPDCQTWGSHRGVAEDSNLLRYYVSICVYNCRYNYRSIAVPSSSWPFKVCYCWAVHTVQLLRRLCYLHLQSCNWKYKCTDTYGTLHFAKCTCVIPHSCTEKHDKNACLTCLGRDRGSIGPATVGSTPHFFPFSILTTRGMEVKTVCEKSLFTVTLYCSADVHRVENIFNKRWIDRFLFSK
jgi:hypothetical protein